MTKGGEGRQEELLDGRRGAVRAVDVLVLKKGCRGTLGRASWLERRLQGECRSVVFKAAGSAAAEVQGVIVLVGDW